MTEYVVYDDQGCERARGAGLGGVKAYGRELMRQGKSSTLFWSVVEDGVERPLPVAGYAVYPDPDDRDRREDCDRVCPSLDEARAYARYLLTSIARVAEIWEHDGEHGTFIWEALTRAEHGQTLSQASLRSRLSPLAARS
jgi:hypothetical protein